MNILQVLKQEHQQVSEMLEELSETTIRAEKKRQSVFLKLNQSLTIHADFEEKYFYPRVKEYSKTKNMVLEAYEEHHVVKMLLSELQELPVTNETWLAKLTVLKENVTHHVKEEEKDLFPQVKTLLEPSELESLAVEYEAFKQEVNHN